MTWYAKPKGAYSITSEEGKSNLFEMKKYFSDKGYTIESMCGMFGNINGESGLNPWRWNSDTVNLDGSYGLFQFHKAYLYIDLVGIEYHSPNMSTESITEGATPEDGIAQLYCFHNDTLDKWDARCWVSGWESQALYDKTREIIEKYGSDGSLLQEQFSTIDNLEDSTLAFLCCYEKPASPNSYPTRLNYAREIYKLLQGEDPPMPPIPPTPSSKKKMPLYMFLRTPQLY